MTTTDTLLADLADVLERAAKLAAELSATLAIPDDPLREFRLFPGGGVGYVTTYADQLVAGDWVQACHGDTGWHRVDRAKTLTDPATLRLMVNVWMDGSSKWWAPTDAIRVARPAADVVAAQDKTA